MFRSRFPKGRTMGDDKGNVYNVYKGDVYRFCAWMNREENFQHLNEFYPDVAEDLLSRCESDGGKPCNADALFQALMDLTTERLCHRKGTNSCPLPVDIFSKELQMRLVRLARCAIRRKRYQLRMQLQPVVAPDVHWLSGDREEGAIHKGVFRVDSAMVDQMLEEVSQGASPIFNYSGSNVDDDDGLRSQMAVERSDMVAAIWREVQHLLECRGVLPAGAWWGPAVAIISEPGCHQQALHTDYDVQAVKRVMEQFQVASPRAVLVALMPGTRLVVQARSWPAPCEVRLDPGDVLEFSGTLWHAGAAYAERNLRMHCYIETHASLVTHNKTFLVERPVDLVERPVELPCAPEGHYELVPQRGTMSVPRDASPQRTPQRYGFLPRDASPKGRHPGGRPKATTTPSPPTPQQMLIKAAAFHKSLIAELGMLQQESVRKNAEVAELAEKNLELSQRNIKLAEDNVRLSTLAERYAEGWGSHF